MSKVLILSGPNHNFAPSAQVIHGFLSQADGLSATSSEDQSLLASPEMADYDVCVFGIGFTRGVRQADGSFKREPNLTPEEEAGLFQFVRDGKGLVGIHGTAWWIGGEALNLIGGHANWHPPGSTFTVNIADADHPITQGMTDFEVADEIYISAYQPGLHILASATWQGGKHPMAWTKPYGAGKVFYTTLGHGPETFERPAMQQLVTQGTRWAAS